MRRSRLIAANGKRTVRVRCVSSHAQTVSIGQFPNDNDKKEKKRTNKHAWQNSGHFSSHSLHISQLIYSLHFPCILQFKTGIWFSSGYLTFRKRSPEIWRAQTSYNRLKIEKQVSDCKMIKNSSIPSGTRNSHVSPCIKIFRLPVVLVSFHTFTVAYARGSGRGRDRKRV